MISEVVKSPLEKALKKRNELIWDLHVSGQSAQAYALFLDSIGNFIEVNWKSEEGKGIFRSGIVIALALVKRTCNLEIFVDTTINLIKFSKNNNPALNWRDLWQEVQFLSFIDSDLAKHLPRIEEQVNQQEEDEFTLIFKVENADYEEAKSSFEKLLDFYKINKLSLVSDGLITTTARFFGRNLEALDLNEAFKRLDLMALIICCDPSMRKFVAKELIKNISPSSKQLILEIKTKLLSQMARSSKKEQIKSLLANLTETLDKRLSTDTNSLSTLASPRR